MWKYNNPGSPGICRIRGTFNYCADWNVIKIKVAKTETVHVCFISPPFLSLGSETRVSSGMMDVIYRALRSSLEREEWRNGEWIKDHSVHVLVFRNALMSSSTQDKSNRFHTRSPDVRPSSLSTVSPTDDKQLKNKWRGMEKKNLNTWRVIINMSPTLSALAAYGSDEALRAVISRANLCCNFSIRYLTPFGAVHLFL